MTHDYNPNHKSIDRANIFADSDDAALEAQADALLSEYLGKDAGLGIYTEDQLANHGRKSVQTNAGRKKLKATSIDLLADALADQPTTNTRAMLLSVADEAQLTDLEERLLFLVMDGYTTDEVACELGISQPTASRMQSRLIAKMAKAVDNAPYALLSEIYSEETAMHGAVGYTDSWR